MQRRLPGHEIGRSLADLDAIDHQPYMLGFGMFTAHFQAMGIERLLTGMAAFPAELDTFLHIHKSLLCVEAFTLCCVR